MMPMRAEKLETKENSLMSKPTSTRVQVKIRARTTKKISTGCERVSPGAGGVLKWFETVANYSI